MKTPALDAWRRELVSRKRTKFTFDALWRAACAEANALEFPGIATLAEKCQADARQIVSDASRKREAA